MYLLAMGCILLGLRWLDVDPVADWSWVVVLAPFATAASE